jgi:hypothetical protein
MARMTVGQKAVRVLKFILGIRNHRVAAALTKHGFDEAELLTGYRLLQALTRNRLVAIPIDAESPPVLALDAWENKWYPIVAAILATAYPDLYEIVFRNLTQTTGLEVILTVGQLVERIEALPEEPRALLAKRGLDEDAIGEAKEQLALVAHFTAAGSSSVDPSLDAEAEKALWNWYLVWSTIVRTTVTDRRALRAMGYLRRGPNGEEIVEEPPIEEEPIEPATPSTPAQPGTSATPAQPVTPAQPATPEPSTERRFPFDDNLPPPFIDDPNDPND